MVVLLLLAVTIQIIIITITIAIEFKLNNTTTEVLNTALSVVYLATRTENCATILVTRNSRKRTSYQVNVIFTDVA